MRSVTLARNKLEPGADGSLRARPTGEQLEITAQAVFRAIGYRGIPLADVPFDSERELIANVDGRVRRGGGVDPRALTPRQGR